jgi:hypothetical protein
MLIKRYAIMQYNAHIWPIFSEGERIEREMLQCNIMPTFDPYSDVTDRQSHKKEE